MTELLYHGQKSTELATLVLAKVESEDDRGIFHLKPGTRLGIYQMLSTRAGNESIGADSY